MRSLRHFWLAMMEGVVEHRRAIVTLLAVILGVVVVFQTAFYFVSARSGMCGSCHLMDPYVDEWRTSPHAEVACVDCHTEYRYALSRVYFKYAFGVYTTQLRAEVPDDRCLSCHEHQELDTETTFLRNIRFSHKGHLGEMRRGKALHCTSCHSGQLMPETGVRTSHVTLQEQVCFTCHFKGAEKGQAATGCLVCHGPPTTVVTHQGFAFDHQTYLERGVRCATCHVEVIRGDANVPRDRCWSCHVGRMQAFEDSERVHEIHLRKRLIDCRRCHNEIEHGRFGMNPVLGQECSSCHRPSHTSQEQMYIGIGGEGVADTPDTMFLARVACDSCHVEAGGDPRREAIALRESCVQCHGPGYGRMVDDWLRELGGLVQEVGAVVARAESAGRGTRSEAVQAALTRARHNIDFVSAAGGQHNVHYATRLLRSAQADAVSVLQRVGAAIPTPGPVLATEAGFCRVCHSTSHLGTAIPFGGLTYDHNRHVATGISCDTCHSLEDHGETAITREQCMSCHHGPEQTRTCAQCHPAPAAFYMGALPGTGISGDPDFMAQAETGCTDCHDLSSQQPVITVVQQACTTCHDEDYAAMAVDWVNDDQQQLQALAVLIAGAKQQLAAESGAGAAAHRDTLTKAESIYDAMVRAKGAHNIMLANSAYDAANGLLGWAKTR